MSKDMSVESEFLIERRRLSRRVGFWRAAAFIALLALILGAGAYFGGVDLKHRNAHIARININGVITGDDGTLKLIKDVAESNAAAVILRINSPGGTVTGSEALYNALRKLNEKKPVVTFVDGLAASGGYIAAIGGDHIVARRTAIVGSIGVLFQYPDVVKLLDNLGVKVESIKSSPLKASPSPVEATTPEARAAIASVLKDNFDWFKTLVAERRALKPNEIEIVADGRVFSGAQGLGNKLVDAIGNEDDAVAWLEKAKKISPRLPIEDWKVEDVTSRFGLAENAATIARNLGLTPLATLIELAAPAKTSVVLDGALVIWQPSLDISKP
jgi:protease-4